MEELSRVALETVEDELLERDEDEFMTDVRDTRSIDFIYAILVIASVAAIIWGILMGAFH